MNIYEIGTEKCIDGVWGREVNGRFYTWYAESGQLYRELDIDNPEYHYFVYYDVSRGSTSLGVERSYLEYKNGKTGTVLTQYIPKHIKDLENLKRGDVVWVSSVEYGNKEQWASARFIEHDSYDYLVANLFDADGKSLRHFSHKEVFLKPPFDF
jgi:hypothetical protein